ncbi:Sulfite exporter TauE/SafE [Kingella potus]|uniref:Probable membrane transporter protein n=1 Tax=Kingella potus TaxID=265175 RepID=A0A377QYE3_9NEIS|nr:sulfite exporter TauE/SafE family protein [Kingella potus]UOP01662.1 sulfite exporter TauE/SafE family protein [Kingella potus]STR00037.1 Sulfite exporter TauE/SafE [Kingella potus]
MDWTANDWIIVCFFVIGALLHGITGFGYPIVGTAVIAGFYPLKTAVAMVVLPCLVINIMMLRTGEGFKHNILTYGRSFFPLFASSFVGGLIGIGLLLFLPESGLKIFLCLTLLFYVFTQYSRFRIRFKKDNITMAVFGFFAGIVGGATNAIVAFLMIYLLGTDRNKTEMVMANNISILITKLIQIVMLFPVIAAFGQKDWLLLSAVIVISLGFMYVGNHIRHRLPQRIFNHAVAAMLLALGLYAGYQGYQGMAA